MYCVKCGTKLDEDAAFCTNCGTKTLIALSAEENNDSNIATPSTTSQLYRPKPLMTEKGISDELKYSDQFYIKSNWLGLVKYKKINTRISYNNSLEGTIRLHQERSFLLSNTTKEHEFPRSELKNITYKNSYDVWDTLYAIIFCLLALLCLYYSVWEGVIGNALIAACCFYTGSGISITLYSNNSYFTFPAKNKDDFYQLHRFLEL